MPLTQDTSRDTYWKHQVKLKRSLRLIKDDNLRQIYCNQLAAHGIPIDIFIDRFDEDPMTVMQLRLDSGVNEPGLPPPSVDLADYPIAKDLILPKRPFSTWAAEQGDPDWQSDPAVKKDAIATRYTPFSNDTSEVGAEVHEVEKIYEKRNMVTEGGSFATSSADPASGGSPFWFRVA